jgi:flavin-dependent dehydrogenase
MNRSPDLLVIGGGPAGLATAIAAADAGLSVTVAEPCAGPVDKCCGEGLLPGAVLALEQLGIARDALLAHGQRLEGIQFIEGQRQAQARFGSPGFGLRRTALHALLADRAQQLGVQRLAAPARMVFAGNAPEVIVGSHRVRPRWVVGADGTQSAVREAAGLANGRVVSRRFAMRQHFSLATGTAQPAFVEVLWARGAQAYVTPVGPDQVGVAILSRQALHPDATSHSGVRSMDQALTRFPALQARLTGAPACSTPRGAVTFHRTLAQITRGSVALVGDAAGSVDAITGDGLSLSFLSALALGNALRQGQLEAYEQVHRELFRVPKLMSRVLLTMGAHPAGTAAAMALLGTVPHVFSSLLKLHTHVPHLRSRQKAEDSPWQIAPTST